MTTDTNQKKELRYGVVGLGYIAQMAVLPGFKTAHINSRLTALVSGDATKLKTLGDKYGVDHRYSYEQYDEFLKSGVADAVYIALPNTLHKEFSVRAANAGLHVLCEKPMATTEIDADAMITAAERNKVKLMVAYRLHFDPANIEAIEIVSAGRLGKPRIFNSVFTRQVKPGDIRTKEDLGGGTLWDLGIYCINAARYLFRDEPTHVAAFAARGTGDRFKEVDEMTTAILRFPGDRFASFTCSFGAADAGSYEIIGTEATLRMEPAYEYAEAMSYRIETEDKTAVRKVPKHDQFGAELIYFSDCVLSGKTPEPSGHEGKIDITIIRAIYEAARTGRTLELPRLYKRHRVDASQKIQLPPVRQPELVHAEPMSS